MFTLCDIAIPFLPKSFTVYDNRVMDTVVGQVTDIGHSSEEFWGSQSLRALWRKGF